MTAGECAPSPFLVTVSGQDAPGIAQRLFAALADQGVAVHDVEQVHVHGRLLLCVEADIVPLDVESVQAALIRLLADGVEVSVEPLVEAELDQSCDRHLVTVLAPQIDAATLEGVTGRIAACGGNIERIVRLSSYPVHSYELSVAGADLAGLRRAVAEEAASREVDVAVQLAGLHRRAKHLIVMDADSTLLQGEVIDVLAESCGCGSQVAAVTNAAMAGELDFEEALSRRVRLLAGLKEADLDAVRHSVLLTPGARTLVRTLKRLGYEIAVVSGGFRQVMEPLVRDLGIDHLTANVFELDGEVVTGELEGDIVDRAGKADALVRFATEAGVPLARTIGGGDGANDIDMLAVAGLGIAFNARDVVRRAADTALSVPYLDAILLLLLLLLLLGISRREVELADRLERSVAS